MIVVTHGGAGSPSSWKDGCEKAAKAGMDVLLHREPALDAAIRSVVSLEDDGRFNAGSGSVLRLDGKTIEMDAAVMDSRGTLGAVAIISGVKNPVLVAREVSKTDHHFLAGNGAVAFARKRGFPEFYPDAALAREKHEKVVKALAAQAESLRENWNFEVPFEEIFLHDTVGAVTLDADGSFAAAVSTGGSGGMLQGRVGDTPLIGSGFFVGGIGAVAVTGIGEEIMKRLLSKTIYDFLAAGVSPQEACENGVALFPSDIPVGAIAVSLSGGGASSNRDMAFALLAR